MSVVPQWVVGRFVTAISIQGLTVNAATGVVTPVSPALLLTALLEEISLQISNTVNNIVPLDIRQDNEVITGTGFQLTLTELLSPTPIYSLSNGVTTIANGPELATVAMLFDYAQFTFTRAGHAWTFVAVIKEYAESVRRERAQGVLTIGPAGIPVSYI